MTQPPQPEERVLSTMNRDGSHRWLRPKLSKGRFLSRRRVVAYLLMLVFTALPFARINGKPPLLFDLPRREFTFFGTTFLPTDTLLLALLLLGIFLAIFFVTALFGRVWCGWACPQTVYMEFLYRPIERLFEGSFYRSGGKRDVHPMRHVAKHVTFFLLSLYLAHTFLAYFVGTDALFDWIRQSPFEHPTSFLVMATILALMTLDFGFMREQVCTLLCPYGRFQSVLLDTRSLIVSYDQRRGEPRGRRSRGAASVSASSKGDCVDCSLCVTTCPTGIDIREGLQMECVGCAQCIDACDAVMHKIGLPAGLIRYSSQEAMAGEPVKLLRPRVVAYPLLIVAVFGLFGWALADKGSADVTFLRTRNATYRLIDDGQVANIVQVKLTNRSPGRRRYEIEVPGGARVESSDLPLLLEAGASGSATLHITLGLEKFESGRAEISVRITDDQEFSREFRHHVLGPLFGGSKGGWMKSRVVWIGIVVGLLSMSVVTQGILIVASINDPSFAVEPDYERKAADWDKDQLRREASRRLGWTADLSTRATTRPGEIDVGLALYDRYGKPVREAAVQIEMFHNARASRILRLNLEPAGDGLYSATTRIRRPGLWEFRLQVRRADDLFVETLRKNVRFADPPAGVSR